MWKLNRIIITAACATTISYLFAQLEIGALTIPWIEQDPVEIAMDNLSTVDPYIHAVIKDHRTEFQPIMEQGLASKDMQTLRKQIAGLVQTYGQPVVVQADDTHLLELARRMNDLLQDMSKWMPESCKGFAIGNLPSEIGTYTGIKDTYRLFSEAERSAYENGKQHGSHAFETLGDVEAAQIAIDYLNFVEGDAKAVSDIDKSTDDAVCTSLLKMYSVESVPEEKQAIYFRTLLKAN